MCTQSKRSCVAFKEGCQGPDSWPACQACSSVNNKPHPHAASMKLYAEDAAETDKPWERWEFRYAKDETGYWRGLASGHPRWIEILLYRRKRKMRTVKGFYVPAPETEAPGIGTTIFIADPTQEEWHSYTSFCTALYDRLCLARGLIFLNEADAIANAKAMCGIDPNL